jgi:hypothetical protein
MNHPSAVSRSRMHSKSGVTERLEELLDEIRAINAWDLHYLNCGNPDWVDRVAWEARRSRLKEIGTEVEVLVPILRSEQEGPTIH